MIKALIKGGMRGVGFGLIAISLTNNTADIIGLLIGMTVVWECLIYELTPNTLQ